VRGDLLVEHAVGLDRAEPLREIDVLLRRQLLVGKYQHRVFPERGLDGCVVFG
jgi:hypothetical protein